MKVLHIKDKSSLEECIQIIDGLHDSILHEVVLLHPGYVNNQQQMYGDAELPEAKLIFQSQNANVQAFQINFKKVSKFNLDFRKEFSLDGEKIGNEIVLYPCGKESSHYCEIRAAEMECCILDQHFLGQEYKLIKS